MKNHLFVIIIISSVCLLIACNKKNNPSEKTSEIMNKLIINEIDHKEPISIDLAEKLLEDNSE